MYGLIDGLDETRLDDIGERYYHSNEMKRAGIFIEAHNSVIEGENGEFICDTWIAVKQVKSNDVVTYTLYWQDALAEIQIYHIIKDTYEIFQKCELATFESIMTEMSTQYQSASMQSDVGKRLEMIKEMQEEFKEVYSLN